MDYESLSKVYYKNHSNYNAEYMKRYEGYGTFRTGFFIRPVRKGVYQGEPVDLFVVGIPYLIQLQEDVMKNSFKIQNLIKELPNIAVEPYFKRILINELQSTNEIEGIRSTKQEISEAMLELGAGTKHQGKKKRFVGLVKTYLSVDNIGEFKTLQDFRNLFDEMVADEVKDEDQPDGELFRKGPVNVTDGLKVTHIGIEPETRIHEKLKELIHFLSDSSTPGLIRSLLGHYIYEYIHPFYDGNGRTGRLLVGRYIAKELDRYSALTLSWSINRDKQKYYKALEDLSHPLNQGEATFYCIAMLEMLKYGQESIIDDLSFDLSKLNNVKSYMRNYDNHDEETKKILLILLTSSIFSERKIPLTNMNLEEISKLTRYRVDKIMKQLEKEGVVEKVRNRPVQFQVKVNFVNRMIKEGYQ